MSPCIPFLLYEELAFAVLKKSVREFMEIYPQKGFLLLKAQELGLDVIPFMEENAIFGPTSSSGIEVEFYSQIE